MIRNMKAAIFDMDGTLIDSMGYWRNLNAAFVKKHGVTPTPEQEARMYSMSGTMVVSYFQNEFGIKTDYRTLFSEACDAMEPVYTAGVPHKPGAAAYLKRLRARGVKCVVATASPAKLALLALNKANLVGDLDYIFSTELFGTHKNDPAFFAKLSEWIGVPQEACVMFEDALYAMQGARRAGLGVVGITDSTNVTDMDAIRACCDVVIDSYDELE